MNSILKAKRKCQYNIGVFKDSKEIAKKWTVVEKGPSSFQNVISLLTKGMQLPLNHSKMNLSNVNLSAATALQRTPNQTEYYNNNKKEKYKKKRSSLKSQKSNSRNFRYKKKRKNFGCKNAQ